MIEATCHVSKKGIVPVKVEDVPEHCWLLIRTIKMYEKLTVEAIRTKIQGHRHHGADAPSRW